MKERIKELFQKEYPATHLYADRSTGQPAYHLGEIEEQNDIYMTLKTGEETDKGIITGICGSTSFWMILILGGGFLYKNNIEGALTAFGFCLALFIVPFLWEILHPLPLPILFNRRTREAYFIHQNMLHHTPWEGIQAVSYQFDMTGLYSGTMGHAALEVQMHRFREPEKQILVSLNMPMGRDIPTQQGIWEYIRAYMNEGPWFDRDGRHSDSDEYVRQCMKKTEHSLKNMFHGELRSFIYNDYPEGRSRWHVTSLFMLLGNMFIYPAFVIQEFTYDIARRRARNQWPDIVLERLRPDGPTTRLIDLEQPSPQSIPASGQA